MYDWVIWVCCEQNNFGYVLNYKSFFKKISYKTGRLIFLFTFGIPAYPHQNRLRDFCGFWCIGWGMDINIEIEGWGGGVKRILITRAFILFFSISIPTFILMRIRRHQEKKNLVHLQQKRGGPQEVAMSWTPKGQKAPPSLPPLPAPQSYFFFGSFCLLHCACYLMLWLHPHLRFFVVQGNT